MRVCVCGKYVCIKFLYGAGQHGAARGGVEDRVCFIYIPLPQGQPVPARC